MNLISQPQRTFIESLLADRLVTLGLGSLEDAVEAMRLDSLERRDASTIIERLKALPKDPDPTMPAVVAQSPRSGRGNRPGKCTACSHVVGQGAGYYYLTGEVTLLRGDGRWGVHHKVGECSEAPAPATVEVTEGFYRLTDDTVVQVYMTRNARLAGKVMNDKGRFVYQSGASRLAEMGERLTPEQVASAVCVARYGHDIGSPELLAMAVTHSTESGACMFCDKVLDDPRSNPNLGGVGYGPKCASNYGLPWGAK